jgi:hypothetical protein
MIERLAERVGLGALGKFLAALEDTTMDMR